MPNHQGPCPPEGVAPIPEAQYERIRELWPDYGFTAYEDRKQNTQCAPGDADPEAGGAGGASGNAGESGGAAGSR
jgi:hypothetical protein